MPFKPGTTVSFELQIGPALLWNEAVVDCPQMPEKAGKQAMEHAHTLGQLSGTLEGLKLAVDFRTKVFSGILAVALAAVVGAGVWILKEHLPDAIAAQLAPISQDLKVLQQKVEDIDENQKRILPGLIEQLLKRPAAGKPAQLKQRLMAAQALLAVASNQKIISKPDQLPVIAGKLQQLAADNPSLAPLAWETFQRVVEYRSALNAKLFPIRASPQMKIAECIHIGPNVKVTVRESILEGCRQKLDGGVWVDVIFRNVIVEYEGGPVVLQNVRLENCQFQVRLSPEGRTLGEAILTSAASTVVRIPS